MKLELLVAGGGIGGLAAALSALQAGCRVRLFEKADMFSEVGAGIQLGPNVIRILHAWGLENALASSAAYPQQLVVRDASSAALLGRLRLGNEMARRYGSPYATIHRADLHRLLLDAVCNGDRADHADLRLSTSLHSFIDSGNAVRVQTSDGVQVEGGALIGADGLWSGVRQQLLADGPPRSTGHLAYRALVPQSDLPAALRTQDVTVWMGPRLHVVHYPVRCGELLNIVAFVHGRLHADEAAGWDHSANAADLAASLAGSHPGLLDLIKSVSHWGLWPMCDRPPMRAAGQHAQGRVALLGDAAHPMRPYLAQGAGMAIEDAQALGHALVRANDPLFDVPAALQRYALNRWRRNAGVQARALRNGEIFHAQGVMRWGRDTAMKLVGEKLLDMPWLYGYVNPASPARHPASA